MALAESEQVTVVVQRADGSQDKLRVPLPEP